MYRKYLLEEIKNTKRILVVRHGQSIWNHDSKFTGWTNIPLTEKGKEEAKQIAKSLLANYYRPNIIFSSVLDRAIQTSNIIKKELNYKNIHIHTSWRLNEKHYGMLEGIPRQNIRNIFGTKFTEIMRGNFTMKPPILNETEQEKIILNTNISTSSLQTKYPIYRNCYFEKIKYGESKEELLNRLLPYFENDICYTFNEHKFPLIVTHKHCARVLMKHLLNIDDYKFEKFDIPSKKIIYIELNDDLTYKMHNYLSY